jgi:hypothetical protein
MQKRQCILGVQNFNFLMLNMRFGMTLEHSKHAALARGVDAQIYSLYLYMLYKRHALLHVHHLSAKIHQNLPPKTDQVLVL